MEILEQFIKGKKNNQALCEDMLFINEYFVAVVDGVTAKSERLFDGKSPGKAAAEAVCDVLKGLPYDVDVSEATALFTESIAALYDGESDGSAAAGVIVFSRIKNEIWSIGDCQCIINGRFFSHEKAVDRVLSNMRALVLEAELKNGTTVEELLQKDAGREFILPMLKQQHIFANTDGEFSYGVLNGLPVPDEKKIIYKVCKGDEIVLASDGYPKLFETLSKSEEYLAKELEENPLCIGDYCSTKGIQEGCDSFDDRTYIRFKV